MFVLRLLPVVEIAVTQYSHCEYWLNAFAHILVVELGLTGLTSTSRNVRRTFHVPSFLFQILRTVKDFPTVHF